jgi:hypothetical protein
MVCSWQVSGQVMFPKIGATFDFDPSSMEGGAYGFKVSVFDNRKFWGNMGQRNVQRGNTLPYSYGLAIGSYRVIAENEIETSHKYLNQLNLIFVFNYQNKSHFDPFVGIYPGYAWGAKAGFFFNPVLGTNIRLFDINRNWNSSVLRTFFQVRAEYNTVLSAIFAGGGFVLQIF